MSVTIELRNNETGEVRTFSEDFATPFIENRLWQWTEDGYSCDCNRSLMWGEEWDGYFQPPCVEGGYAARITETDTGRVLLDEFDRPFEDALAERIRILRYSVELYRADEPGALQGWIDAHPAGAAGEEP